MKIPPRVDDEKLSVHRNKDGWLEVDGEELPKDPSQYTEKQKKIAQMFMRLPRHERRRVTALAKRSKPAHKTKAEKRKVETTRKEKRLQSATSRRKNR